MWSGAAQPDRASWNSRGGGERDVTLSHPLLKNSGMTQGGVLKARPSRVKAQRPLWGTGVGEALGAASWWE